MGIARAVTIGSGVGAVAAVALYVAAASPSGTVDNSVPAVARAAPTVPVFTTTAPAPCDPPATLEDDVCVTHVAGRPTTLPVPAGPDHGPEAGTAPLPLGARAPRSGPAASSSVTPEDEYEHEDEYDGEDEPEFDD
jgi:hypothetical protein